ncbi:CASP-like protein 4A3 [Euphorbia peplus]|nr:CASP-like protein 4A3 [Euphorbia peplus]
MSSSKSKPRIIIPNRMKRSSSSNSENYESPHSPLRINSPLPSDQGSPPFVSPMNSPSIDNSMAIVALDKATQFTPQQSPLMPQDNNINNNNAHPFKHPPQVNPMMLNRAIKEDGPTVVGKVRQDGRQGVVWRSRRERTMKVADLGFRVSEVILCLVSFSVMAADKTQGWSGDSFDRYKEYRYCLSVNVIGFVYSAFQACGVSYHLATGKHIIRHHLRCHFDFLIDQAIAYLLISAASSAATRVDDWQSNWGKDEFTEMATASVAMAFLAFVAFAVSSIISAYHLWNNASS